MVQFIVRLALASVFVISIAPIGVAHAETDMVKAFGSMPGVLDISLSPDGNSVAFIAPTNGIETDLYWIDLNGDPTPKKVLTASGDPERLETCGWVSNRRLACKLSGLDKENRMLYGFTNVFSLNVDRSNPQLLSRRRKVASGGGSIVDWLPEEENSVLMTGSYAGGVAKIDTTTGKAKPVERGGREAVEYITDGEGNVRIKGMRIKDGRTELDSGRIKYFYRPTGLSEWEVLSRLDYANRKGFNPYAVDPTKEVAYGFQPYKGRKALVSVKLDGSGDTELVYSHDEVDVDGLIRIGRKNRVVGASYATDKRHGVYFDPTLKKLADALSKALGDNRIIQFVDSNLDESKLLVFASSDIDPGKYYLFDKTSKSLRPLLAIRPLLADVKLASVKPIQYPASDGTMIPGYLTLPVNSSGLNLPAIVMPHGGPASRDEWGFDWWAQFYASQGFAVLQPNFRGSGGYGNDWYQRNGYQSWRTAVGDVADAGSWLIAEGIAKKEALSIVGWSYGGYAALQAAVVQPDLFKSVVAIAPVTDLKTLKSDSNNYYNEAVVRDFVGSGPHITEGSPAQNAERINAPVLLVHGDFDYNVDIGHSRLMQKKLEAAGKKVEYIEYPRLEHSLQSPEARMDMLKRSLDFLPK